MVAIPDSGNFMCFSEDLAEGLEVDFVAVSRNLEILSNDVVVCAPSFEEFLYCIWLEAAIWFKLNGDDQTSLTRRR